MKTINIIFIIVFSFFIPVILTCLTDAGLVLGKEEYSIARKQMVQYQIRLRGINDNKVLTAMETVLRHEFVPPNVKARAYEDRPLPIGYGQTISQPYIVALMTELLKVDKDARVLEVGTGSGYQAAVLARIVKEVYSVEIVRPLHDRSKQVLKKLKYQNIFTIHKDGYFGWEEYAPYDAIIVTCASNFIPPPLIKQLKPGGRMCIPVGPPFKVQHLVLVEKGEDEKISTTIIASVRFVPLCRDGD
jgi:protein-L-isoaspartate(D-aspartate) O-methyltransferase